MQLVSMYYERPESCHSVPGKHNKSIEPGLMLTGIARSGISLSSFVVIYSINRSPFCQSSRLLNILSHAFYLSRPTHKLAFT